MSNQMIVTVAAPEELVALVIDDRLALLDDLASDVVACKSDSSLRVFDLIDDWEQWQSHVMACFERLAADPEKFGKPVTSYRLMAPIPHPRRNPFLIAGNYLAHVAAGELASGIPYTQRKTAIFFTKPPSAISGPNDDIEVDVRHTQMLDYETELVVVIGRRGRNIPAEEAMDYVFGYMIGDDVSARDIIRSKPTADFLRGKGMDTFFPLGPGIVLRNSIPDYRDLTIRTYVNGDLKQNAKAGDMTRDIPTIIAELSRGITLEPGDIIATGTPSGVQGEQEHPAWLSDGDVVISEIEGIGRLVNRVKEIRI